MPWYVLYTKPRNEKKTAQRLEDKGIEVYCPLQETVKQWSDRKKKVKEPLFRSYLFVRMAHYQRENAEILFTPGAVRFLWWQGKPGIVKDKEIELIRRFLNEYDSVEAVPLDVAPGTEVMITAGALADKKGRVLREQKNQVSIVIESLGYKLVALVNKGNVKRI